MTMPKGNLIGHCGVDSGQILLIDPCYVYKDEYGSGGDYDQCCRITLSDDGAGQTDLGVVTSSGYGDGVYPVYAKKDANGRIVSVTIEFA